MEDEVQIINLLLIFVPIIFYICELFIKAKNEPFGSAVIIIVMPFLMFLLLFVIFIIVPQIINITIMVANINKKRLSLSLVIFILCCISIFSNMMVLEFNYEIFDLSFYFYLFVFFMIASIFLSLVNLIIRLKIFFDNKQKKKVNPS